MTAGRRLGLVPTAGAPEVNRRDPAVAIWQAAIASQLGPLDNHRLLLEAGCSARLNTAIELMRDRADDLDTLADQDG